MRYYTLLFTVILLACTPTNQNTPDEVTYYKARKGFVSTIVKKIPAPQSFDTLSSLHKDIKLITYPSEGMELQGLLHTANIDSGKRTKALVYLHGGFALGYGDIYDCQPFIDSGFVVFAPSYRGENGNPGSFEYFMGEARDAENAVKWLSKQEFINTEEIYIFGHSIGGGISLLLSLHNNCPSQLNGSSAGLYFKENLEYMVGKKNIPFSTANYQEYLFRCPLYTLRLLPRKHYMYIGKDDDFQEIKSTVQSMYDNIPNNFVMKEINGDHFTSLTQAMVEFIAETKNTVGSISLQ